jgi:transcriptional regulator with XRE-family HTH domain
MPLSRGVTSMDTAVLLEVEERKITVDVKIDGKNVRAVREQAFLSKAELAEDANLDRNTIGRIENRGIVGVYPRTIHKIANALSVDPASLTPEGE